MMNSAESIRKELQSESTIQGIFVPLTVSYGQGSSMEVGQINGFIEFEYDHSRESLFINM